MRRPRWVRLQILQLLSLRGIRRGQVGDLTRVLDVHPCPEHGDKQADDNRSSDPGPFECLDKANQIRDPFEQSFFMMVHLPYLQPFADINKRTSRLAANLPLFRANLCPLTFLDVPEQAYSRATLGVYEMTRVELLRDLYVWAYERSTQEYLAIKQDLAEPDPLRLAWRDFIKQTIRAVITHPELDPLSSIQRSVAERVPEQEQPDVQALIVEELRRLHEGVLARYGLRPSEYAAWRALHGH
ncbi:hypothetical protein THICB1_20003 [Thiomonas arsenitoxydans]|uniref:Fido domain-containing protein n=1 Tax=Thiomonas arsenitoxydans (strain DSM 22701 / CIP 110005 / 3As) TaxID=426114 RepID=A0ABM9T4C7_THIA3|nr:hypothetical protein THICB6_120179 [Thiomonas arsenitoxydans]CQR31854.1 hypothetical protein THICB1_20003 [Thiomonas arsenitoxydans]CQR34893.1 hypothetical protein ACO7_420017 [Thiomonas arsenitoxydans]CQR34960.1 hypothetical protein ACO3_420024 [Thiomonas arsenitoxydans]CQR44525.1 hypothetical protein THICB3520022 [Thiomonas sp. CB3]